VNCRKWTIELVECARIGLQPGAELQDHLRGCFRCIERWDDERRLSAQFRTMRYAAAARQPSVARRDEVMREFALAHKRATHPSLGWALSIAAILLSIAAILLLGVAVGQAWRNGQRPTASADTKTLHTAQNSGTSSPANSMAQAQQTILLPNEFAASTNVEKLSEDNDFVAVPYTPPLATGEFVRVVRMELHPIALARMGIYVNAADANDIPAEVVVGEDGLPRAVRVFGDKQF
jgi:hypothetical protein